MKASIAIGVASSLASVALSQVVGVAPSDQELYEPDAEGKWRCLSNPEVVLDFSQINDDFCDCPDGSDEPGTSACPNGKFYCENKGHVPGYIKSFKVNDGVCDYSECCDGSDEWNTPIDCPSRCEEIHKEYQKALDLEKETYKIGVSKVEKTINAASKLRAKLHEQFTAESAILEFLQKELAAKKATLEQAQARGEINQDSSQAQHKIKESIEEIKSKVSDYFGSFTSSDSNLKSLSEILDALVQTFNENLKDAAVKDTVDSYAEHLEKYKESYDAEKSETFQSFDAIKNSILDKFNSLDLTGNTDSLKTTFNELSETLKQELLKHNAVNERANDLEKLLNHLINNYNPNFNDPNVKQAVNSFQDFSVNRETFQVPTDETISWLKSKIEQVEQLAESLKKSEAEPKIEEKKTQVKKIQQLPLLERLKNKYRKMINDFLGIETKEQYEAHHEETNETKDDLQIAVEELEKDKDKTERSVNSIKEDLSRYYGPNDLLRPLKDISLKGHIGEYDYELFFIGDVHQKGNNHNVKIGSFSSIEVNDISRTQHQLILTYENGARCWNGPLRKGIVTIDCGAENELLAVTEPEKCEYHFRVK
ncbi:hypothetical protein WICANDRAFT_40380, partial [Wickerhamomyces anomalus NRRL Y-366-8]